MKREWGMIATWRMAGDAIKLGAEILNEKGKCQDAVEKAIMQVEDYPFYKSVKLPTKLADIEVKFEELGPVIDKTGWKNSFYWCCCWNKRL